MTSETAVLIYPVHLFENLEPILSKSKQKTYKYYLLEEPLYFSSDERVLRFNGLKLLLHRVSMKIYQSYLRDNGLNIEYIDFKDMHLLPNKIKAVVNILYYDTVDHLLEQKITELTKGKNVNNIGNSQQNK